MAHAAFVSSPAWWSLLLVIPKRASVGTRNTFTLNVVRVLLLDGRFTLDELRFLLLSLSLSRL